MLYLLAGYVTVLFEELMLKIFFDTFIKPRNESKYKIAVIFFTLSILDMLLSLFLGNNFIVKQIAVIIVTFLFMKMYSKSLWRKVITLTILNQAILLITDYITLILKSIFFPDADVRQGIAYILLIAVDKTVLFLIIMIIKGSFRKREFAVLEDSDWIKFIFFPIFTVCMIIAMISHGTYEISDYQGELFLFLSVGLIVLNVVMFYLLNDILLKTTKIKDDQIYMLEARNQLELYEKLSDVLDRHRSISHEYQNQLNIIQGLCEKQEIEELKKYLIQINGESLHDLDRIETNHVIVNTVINEKYAEARSKGITFICKINDMSQLKLDNQDIATLLSNLLNNAMEASEKQNDKKMIKFKMMCKGNKVVLSCKNTYNGEVKKVDSEFVTTKHQDAENHGYGLKNIIRIVEKYNGDYVISPAENEFFVSIILRNSSTK